MLKSLSEVRMNLSFKRHSCATIPHAQQTHGAYSRFSMPILSLSLLIAMSLALSLAGCATTTENLLPEVPPMHSVSEFKDQSIAEVEDPWERTNRSMYKFNFYADKYFLIPVVDSYEFVTPTFVQGRISNFFDNIGEVRNLTNNLFQLKGMGALTTLGRFLTNSTVGLAGFFDPATSFGMIRQNEDFGRTLGHWGVESGPYLVLPVLGPSNVRDTAGFAVDTGIRYGIFTAIDPFNGINNESAIMAGVSALEAVDMRHRVKFRYYESGYPFEYYVVRFLYNEKRTLDIKGTSIGQGGSLF